MSLGPKHCRSHRCTPVAAFAGTALPVAPDCVLACEMTVIGQTVISATVERISGADRVALAGPSASHHGNCPALVAQESKRTERERRASNAGRPCISPQASRRRAVRGLHVRHARSAEIKWHEYILNTHSMQN